MTHADAVDILLVEDSPDDAELTLRALRKANLGDRLLHVRDGQEALDFIFASGQWVGRRVENPPRVVLLDLKLPKVNGLEVLRVMKTDARTRTVPIVALTSSKEERDVLESYRLGVNSYIIKPVDFDKFVDSVQQLGLYWMIANRSP